MVADSPPLRAPASPLPPIVPSALHQRALAHWPRLDRRVLNRCGADARRIARYVSRRTSLSVDAIEAILQRGSAPDEGDIERWFG